MICRPQVTCRTPGFTVIELLVVVTIIVVLLALLTPALDKAIYQVELAVCATHHRSVAVGAVVYASASKRFYPYRDGVRDDTIWPAAMIYNGSMPVNLAYDAMFGGTGVTVYDDRPLLRTFVGLNAALNDPLTGRLDFENADPDCTVYATGNLWFGYQFKGQQGMRRVGDRWTWSGTNAATGKPANWAFDVLAADRDTLNGANVQTGHPDADGKTVNVVVQNNWFAATGLKFTISLWQSSASRGAEDLNYARQDGSVLRYDKVLWMDPEMAHVPEMTQKPNGWWQTLPVQR